MRMTTYLKTIIIHFTYCMREKSWEAKWLYYTVTNLWFIQTCGQWSADDNHSFVPSMYNLHSGLKSHKTSSLEISPHGVWMVGFLNIFFFQMKQCNHNQQTQIFIVLIFHAPTVYPYFYATDGILYKEKLYQRLIIEY